MSVLSYLQGIGAHEGQDLEGMPEFVPARVSEAGTLHTNYLVTVPADILDFLQGLTNRPFERANNYPGRLFCPGSMSMFDIDEANRPVGGDLRQGNSARIIVAPQRELSDGDYDSLVSEWERFLLAREARKNARWEEPVALQPAEDQVWLDEGVCRFDEPGKGIDALVLVLQEQWLYGVGDKRAEAWHLTAPRALSMEAALDHGVLVEPSAKEVTSRQAFVDVAREHGVQEAIFELHRRVSSLPDLGELVRDAVLTGLPHSRDLKDDLAELRKLLPKEEPKIVPATNSMEDLLARLGAARAKRETSVWTPAEKQIIDAARTAVAELEHAVAVVEGMRVAREHYGIDIAGERAGALADLEARIAEATAKRDALNAELKSLGGKKGSRAQALARAEAELAALQERREAMKAEVAAEERQAQDAIAKVRATVDAEVAKVSAGVQRQVADLEARRVELTEAVSALAARVGALDDTPAQEDDEVPVLALMDPADLTRALEGQGLRYAPAWPTRFLVAALAARRVGSLLLLAGPTGTGKTRLVRQVAGLLEGSGQHTIPVRPEWLAASDLLGYVDPIRDTFAPTDFVAAVRAATVTDFRNAASGDAPDAPVPWFLLLDELNLARVENFGADLLSALDAPGGDPARVLRLFPEDVRTGWLREWDALKERGDLDARETWRADLLGRMFDPGAHRQTGAAAAHLLTLPPNLVVCGTLNTDRHTHELSPKVFDRSFVLQMPAPSLDEVLRKGGAAAFAEGASPARYRLPDPPAGVDPLSTTPELLDGFQRAIEALRPAGLMPSFRLARNARAYLAEAAAWPGLGSDTGRLLGDLVHLLLLPRLDCSADAARQALQALTEVTRSWGNADLDRELVELRARADDARHGDFRGLA